MFNFTKGKNEYIKDLEVTKTSTPCLVDLKITDYCSYNCKYCYQGSSTKGNHASLEYIKEVLNSLAKMEVFEIAIGGGEPTEHPEFKTILKMAKDRHITPNFTTRNLKYLVANSEYLSDYIGKVAVSCNNLKEVTNTYSELLECGIRYCVQLTMGTIKRGEFKKILDFCSMKGVDLSLLGFKTLERGSNYDIIDYSWWLSDIRELKSRWLNISIDTSLANEYKDEIKALKDIDMIYISFEEGAFSCYIDCVDKKMCKSSYHNEFVGMDYKGKKLFNEIDTCFKGY